MLNCFVVGEHTYIIVSRELCSFIRWADGDFSFLFCTGVWECEVFGVGGGVAAHMGCYIS